MEPIGFLEPPAELELLLESILSMIDATSLDLKFGATLTKHYVKIKACLKNYPNPIQRKRLTDVIEIIDSLRKLLKANPTFEVFAEKLQDNTVMISDIIGDFDSPYEPSNITAGSESSFNERAEPPIAKSTGAPYSAEVETKRSQYFFIVPTIVNDNETKSPTNEIQQDNPIEVKLVDSVIEDLSKENSEFKEEQKQPGNLNVKNQQFLWESIKNVESLDLSDEDIKKLGLSNKQHSKIDKNLPQVLISQQDDEVKEEDFKGHQEQIFGNEAGDKNAVDAEQIIDIMPSYDQELSKVDHQPAAAEDLFRKEFKDNYLSIEALEEAKRNRPKSFNSGVKSHQVFRQDSIIENRRLVKLSELALKEQGAIEKQPQDAFQDELIGVFELTRRINDCSPNYSLEKSIPCEEASRRLIDNLGEAVKVVGVYGDPDSSRDFAIELLKSSNFILPEISHGIVGLYSKYKALLVLLIIDINMADFKDRPFDKNCFSVELMAYLLDLSQLVVVCPGPSALETWYFSEVPSRENPYKLRTFTISKYQMERTIIQSKEAVSISAANQYGSDFKFSKDSFWSAMAINIKRQSYSSEIKTAESYIIDIVNFIGKTLDNKNRIPLRTLLNKWWVSMPKRKVSQNFAQIRSEVEKTFNEIIDNFPNFISREKQLIVANFFSTLRETFKINNPGTLKQFVKYKTFETIESEITTRVLLGYTFMSCNVLILKPVLRRKEKGEPFDKGAYLFQLANYFDDQIAKMCWNSTENLKRSINSLLRSCMDSLVPSNDENEITGQKLDICLENRENECFIVIQEAGRYFKVVRPAVPELRMTTLSISNDIVMQTFWTDYAIEYYQHLTKERGFRFDIPYRRIEGDAELVPGSTPQRFVVINHSFKKAYCGSLNPSLGIDVGSQLNLFSETHNIVSAYLLCSKDLLIFINEQGLVFYVNTLPNDRKVILVRVEEFQAEESKELQPNIHKIRIPFKPRQEGASFKEVRAPGNEAVYVFRTEFGVEIYDLTFNLQHLIPLDPQLDFKVMSDCFNFIYILTKDCYGNLECVRFTSASETIQTTATTQSYEVIPGNPMADILHCTMEKFSFNRPQRDQIKLAFVFESKAHEKKVKGYVSGLDNIKHEADVVHIGGLEVFNRKFSIESELESEDARQISWMLATRAPLHIASIQSGNLYPLKDGVNNFDQLLQERKEPCKDQVYSDYFLECIKQIRFGIYETLLETVGELRVIGIIGRQSSGKSYLMNQIFGTRFNVSALRCTDGVWMSMAKIGQDTFVVLDCEGLLSTERSEQEEIKMCLALASVCDLLIFNTDISGINRNIASLFEKFSSSKGRLDKEGLFRGSLCITMRDVVNQNDAETQLRKSLRDLEDAGKLDFMLDLFQGNYSLNYLHNFTQKDQFRAEVEENFRNHFQTLPIKWTDGKEFRDKFKIILTQIFTDDNERVDERMYPIIANQVHEVLAEIDFNAKLAKQTLGDFALELELTISEVTKTVVMTDYVELNKLSTKESFDEVLARYFEVELKALYHNEWNIAVNTVITEYYRARADKCIAYLEKKLGSQKQFVERIKTETRTARINLEKVMLEVSLCLLKCSECGLLCTQKNYHKKDKHDCGTDHICVEMCAICSDGIAKCYLAAGHSSDHFCFEKGHSCGRPCTVQDCQDSCIKLMGHDKDVNCRCKKPVHECGQMCLMFDSCERTCREDIERPHDVHDCGQQACLSKCILCERPCESKDHFHNIREDIEKVQHPNEPNFTLNKHMCGSTHSCHEKCQHPGRCKCTYTTEIKTYQNKFNSLPYNYIMQVPLTLDCKHNIEAGELSHEGSHVCTVDPHKCTEICPDCKVYCDLPVDHPGFHSSSNHRNKENCIYLTDSADFVHVTDGFLRKFAAGNDAVIEMCHLACVRAGRGHTHPVMCRGGHDCLEVSMAGKAEHSNRNFNPPGEYDLVRCDAYWALQNWEAPLQSSNPTAFQQLLKCNFYCSHSDHVEEERIFCEESALHTKSNKNCDHLMPPECNHIFKSVYEIVFVVDITYSMDEYVDQVKHAIKQIINRVYPEQIEYRFGIIAFTDHEDAKGSFLTDPWNPTIVYPNIKDLKVSQPSKAIEFLDSLSFDGGGSNKGEAVIDGLFQATSFKYESISKKIMFLVTDDRPHGDEFGQESTYPGGCPCLTLNDLSWTDILRKLKTYDFDIYQIKLNEEFNIAAEKFASFYGPGYHTIRLEDATGDRTTKELSKQIELTVKSTVQMFMEFSSSSSIYN